MTGANNISEPLWQPRWYYVLSNKTSNKLYFGQSTKADISKYCGSGMYWKRHCKKHGGYNRHNIICEAKWWLDDKELAELFLLEFESLNPDYYAESNDKWANLIPETASNTEFLNLSEEQKARAARNRIATLSKTLDGNVTGFELIGKKISDSSKKLCGNGKTVAENRARKTSETKYTVTNKAGYNIHQQSGKKSKETKDKIGADGLTTHQRIGRRTANQKTYIIDENGLNSHQVIGKKISNTKNSPEWKNTVGRQAVEKLKESLSKIEANGLTKAQNRGIQSSKTQRSQEWKDRNNQQCNYCGISCSPGNYKRWHGVNCKQRDEK